MSISTREWVDFFKKAGIPAEESASYALIFSKNRIQKNMLVDLNKEYLKDMGITLLGDIIAILKHAQIVHETDSRALVFTDEVAAVEIIDKIDLTQKKTAASQSGSSATVKRLLDHYTRKFKEAEESLSAIPSAVSVTSEENGSGSFQTSEKSIGKKPLRVKVESHTSPRVEKKRQNSVFTEPILTKGKKLIGGKTVFERLGDGTVSSTTPESKPKKPNQNPLKAPSIFLRLGEVSSTSLEGEKIEPKKDALPYAGVFKHLSASGSGVEASLRADVDELPSSSDRPKHVIKARLNTEVASLKRTETPSQVLRTDFIKARELKMLKITAEFAEDDDVMEVNAPEPFRPTSSAKTDVVRRKRKAGDSDASEIVTLSKSPAKKVRFGGATHMIIPNTKAKYKQKPSKLLQNFTNLKITAEAGDSQREGIKARIGVKPSSPAPVYSKMVSDTMVHSKMVSDAMVRPILTKKASVKARIDLKPKKSVLDRLG